MPAYKAHAEGPLDFTQTHIRARSRVRRAKTGWFYVQHKTGLPLRSEIPGRESASAVNVRALNAEAAALIVAQHAGVPVEQLRVRRG